MQVEAPGVGAAGEVRLWVSGERDDLQAEALEHGQEPEDLVRLAAVAHEDRQVALVAEPEVPVKGLRGVEKAGGDAGAVEGRGDLSGDMGGFPDAAEDQLAARGDGRLHGARRVDEFRAQAPGGLLQGVALDADALPGARKRGFRCDRSEEHTSELQSPMYL